MGFARLSLILYTSLLLSAAMAIAKEDCVNKSTPGLFWATGKEGELFRKSDIEELSTFNDNDELDGGFSSLDGMLQWAIGHSDPAKLKDTAHSVQRLSPDELTSEDIFMAFCKSRPYVIWRQYYGSSPI